MLGDRISFLRRNAGLTQTALANMLSISPSSVGMYEQGRREPPIDILLKLSNIFGVSVDYLLTGDLLMLHKSDREVLFKRNIGMQKEMETSGHTGSSFSREEMAVFLAVLLTNDGAL